MARRTRLYQPGPYPSEGEILELDSEGSHHLGRVLRFQKGWNLELFDNSGAQYGATYLGLQGGRAQVRLGEVSWPKVELPYKVRLALSLVKGERFDWAVEKLTELGVEEIVPLEAEFAQVKGPARPKVERWQRLAQSAAQQSGRVIVPTVATPQTLEGLLEEWRGAGPLIFFVPEAEPWCPQPAAGESWGLFIGPEGGFSEAEVAAARRAGAQFYSLGARILRVETAALAAVVPLALS